MSVNYYSAKNKCILFKIVFHAASNVPIVEINFARMHAITWRIFLLHLYIYILYSQKWLTAIRCAELEGEQNGVKNGNSVSCICAFAIYLQKKILFWNPIRALSFWAKWEFRKNKSYSTHRKNIIIGSLSCKNGMCVCTGGEKRQWVWRGANESRKKRTSNIVYSWHTHVYGTHEHIIHFCMHFKYF